MSSFLIPSKVPEGHHPRGTTLREALRGNLPLRGLCGGLSEGSTGSLRGFCGVSAGFCGGPRDFPRVFGGSDPMLVTPLTLQSLLFWKKQGFSPQKARVFLFAEPLKSLEKRGKTHKKARKIGKRKKQGNRKKQGKLEGPELLDIPLLRAPFLANADRWHPKVSATLAGTSPKLLPPQKNSPPTRDLELLSSIGGGQTCSNERAKWIGLCLFNIFNLNFKRSPGGQFLKMCEKV